MPTSGAVRAANMTQFYTWQHPEQYHADWKGFYREALQRRAATLARYRHELDVKYGDTPYQGMDIFRPVSAQPAPVILYFHGGRWREGHPAFYDRLADPWADDGAIFVSCGYRLEPVASIRGFGGGCARDRQLVGRTRAQPRRESGATGGCRAFGRWHLAAMVALTAMARAVRAPAHVSAAIVMSGVTDLADWGEGDADRLSPARLVCTAPPQAVLSYGSPERNKKDADDWLLTRQGALLDAALTRASLPHVTVVLGAVDHVATARAFAERSSPLYASAQAAILGYRGTA